MVLFCDVADFTAYCDAHPPETVVTDLQHLVAAFEAAAERHGLEKIKTIGDGLMATGDLLLPNPDAVMAGLACAFALIEAARAGPAGGSCAAACISARSSPGWSAAASSASTCGATP